MKIFQENKIATTGYTEPFKKSEKSGDVKFDAILKETMESRSEIACEHARTEAVATLSRVQLNPLSSKTAGRVIEQTEKLLDTMDGYVQKLNDPSVSLKEIYPLVQAMEAENDRIDPILHSLCDTDGLKDILKEVLITSSKEIIKFNRGDYIDQ